MHLDLRTPDLAELSAALDSLASWQRDDLPVQLHPGDLGWNWQSGPQATADLTRLWTAPHGPVALCLVDDGVLRLAMDPAVADDEQVADRLADDLDDPGSGVLPGADASAEVRLGGALRRRLRERGWVEDMPWTPLTMPLATLAASSEQTDAVEPGPGLRVTATDPSRLDEVDAWIGAHRAAWPRSRFDRTCWQHLSSGPAFDRARCLVGWDAQDRAVAATIVWSAGTGRPGLIEPLGADHRHRGRGHGRAITVAAARTLRSMGASSVRVCTPSANVAAVAAYRSAGFTLGGASRDLRRPST